MHHVPLLDYAGLTPEEHAGLAATIATERTLAQVLERVGPAAIVEIITQDEYTHDVLIPFDQRRYLVYDST